MLPGATAGGGLPLGGTTVRRSPSPPGPYTPSDAMTTPATSIATSAVGSATMWTRPRRAGGVEVTRPCTTPRSCVMTRTSCAPGSRARPAARRRPRALWAAKLARGGGMRRRGGRAGRARRPACRSPAGRSSSVARTSRHGQKRRGCWLRGTWTDGGRRSDSRLAARSGRAMGLRVVGPVLPAVPSAETPTATPGVRAGLDVRVRGTQRAEEA